MKLIPGRAKKEKTGTGTRTRTQSTWMTQLREYYGTY